LVFRLFGYRQQEAVLSEQDFKTLRRFVLQTDIQHIAEANVTARKLEQFDVGFLAPIRGVQITTGTNSVIELQQLSGAKSSANPREIFAKIPGLNIWE